MAARTVLVVPVNIPHRGVQVRVARELFEREQVHHLGPPGQASVPEVARNECRNVAWRQRLRVLLLERAGFDVPTPGVGGKEPV